MSFVNAYLTEEEKEKFKEAKIKDPRYKISKKDFLIPGNWTVDRENNISLIYCGVADREEHDKETFALIYKKLDNEHLINLTLTIDYFDKEREKMLEKRHSVNLVRKWQLLDCEIPVNLKVEISDEEIYSILTNALTVYGVGGSPNRVQSVKALLEINGRVIE